MTRTFEEGWNAALTRIIAIIEENRRNAATSGGSADDDPTMRARREGIDAAFLCAASEAGQLLDRAPEA